MTSVLPQGPKGPDDPGRIGPRGPAELFAKVETAGDALALGVSTFFGLGLAKWAPGTFGTLGGAAIAWLLRDVSAYLMWLGIIAAVLYVAGRLVAPWAERVSGKDPGFYVIDEVIGYLVTIAWTAGSSPLALFVGFVVFRFFDILKPPPVSRFERIPGGDGILLDDIVAGLYGLVVMALLRLFVLEPESWLA